MTLTETITNALRAGGKALAALLGDTKMEERPVINYVSPQGEVTRVAQDAGSRTIAAPWGKVTLTGNDLPRDCTGTIYVGSPDGQVKIKYQP